MIQKLPGKSVGDLENLTGPFLHIIKKVLSVLLILLLYNCAISAPPPKLRNVSIIELMLHPQTPLFPVNQGFVWKCVYNVSKVTFPNCKIGIFVLKPFAYTIIFCLN